MNVEETDLPGLGRRKDFMTASGRRIGVVEYREGQTELIASTWDDPDTCQASIPLTADEAAALGNLLGGQRLAMQLSWKPTAKSPASSPASSRSAPNPPSTTSRSARRASGPAAGSRSRPSCEGEVAPFPAPDVVLHPGDLLVAVGTQEGLDTAAGILRNG